MDSKVSTDNLIMHHPQQGVDDSSFDFTEGGVIVATLGLVEETLKIRNSSKHLGVAYKSINLQHPLPPKASC